MNVFKAIQVYYLCNIPEKVRFRGTGFMKQNYTTHWKIHHTGKMLPASSENADLHFCGEMAARDHTGRKQRRKNPALGTNQQVQCPGNNSCLQAEVSRLNT